MIWRLRNMNILDYFPPNYVGFAVEAGAYDGIFFSSTLQLEQAGWSCLCIEPNPRAFAKLRNNRKLTLQFALSNSNTDNVNFEVHYRDDYVKEAGMSSFSPTPRMLSTFGASKSKENFLVNARTLDWCLESVSFPRLDFMALDLEGWELVALAGFDIVKWKPKVVKIENIFGDVELTEYFTKHGYRFECKDGFDDVYVL